MFFQSQYSKMTIHQREEFFKSATAHDMSSNLNKSDLISYHPDDLSQRTPLNYAAVNSDLSVIIKLIEMGGDVFNHVNKFSNPPICEMIAANRPYSDIMLIAETSKYKPNWNAESIGNYSCQIAATYRPNKRMLEFLHNQGVDLKQIYNSKNGRIFSAFSTSIESGPLESVEFLYSLGCSYPQNLRRFFYEIFTSDIKIHHGVKWKSDIPNNDHNDLSSDRWKKIRFIVNQRIIEPHFLRGAMEREKIDADFQNNFWLTVNRSVAKYSITQLNDDGLFARDIVSEFRRIDGLEAEFGEYLQDKRTGRVYGRAVEVTEQWLLDLHNS